MKQPILIVEDDYANQQVATLFLQKFGYESEVVENGLKAVEVTQTKKFPLIYMDCQMPVMDGFTASQHIRDNAGPNQKTPIIALTANLVSGIKELCAQSGMDDVLCKPINMKSLEAITQKWFEQVSTQIPIKQKS